MHYTRFYNNCVLTLVSSHKSESAQLCKLCLLYKNSPNPGPFLFKPVIWSLISLIASTCSVKKCDSMKSCICVSPWLSASLWRSRRACNETKPSQIIIQKTSIHRKRKQSTTELTKHFASQANQNGTFTNRSQQANQHSIFTDRSLQARQHRSLANSWSPQANQHSSFTNRSHQASQHSSFTNRLPKASHHNSFTKCVSIRNNRKPGSVCTNKSSYDTRYSSQQYSTLLTFS